VEILVVGRTEFIAGLGGWVVDIVGLLLADETLVTHD
jgi:hypothetical protein